MAAAPVPVMVRVTARLKQFNNLELSSTTHNPEVGASLGEHSASPIPTLYFSFS